MVEEDEARTRGGVEKNWKNEVEKIIIKKKQENNYLGIH